MAEKHGNLSLLEIDDNIIRKQLLLEGSDSPELTTLLPSPTPPATMITPKPGICVKTRDSQGRKVFVNMCTSPEISAPEDLSDHELIAILESDEPSDFRFPMSIGEPHSEVDKSGAPCIAYDVIINPHFLDKMIDSPLFHNFGMIATLEGLEEKYSSTLDKNKWTVLKNNKYHGQMSEQCVRTMKPLVQQLSGARQWTPSDLPPSPASHSSASPLITEVSTKSLTSDKLGKPQPKYSLRWMREEGGVEMLVAEVNLPGQATGNGVDARVGDDRLIVEGDGCLLDIFLPLSLDNTNPFGHFVTSDRVLILRVPILHI